MRSPGKSKRLLTMVSDAASFIVFCSFLVLAALSLRYLSNTTPP